MGQSYRFGPFTVDPAKRVLARDGVPVPLTPKAFDLLLFLAQNPNRVVTKEELLENVWAGTFVEEGNLSQNVFLLRKALAEQSGEAGMIVTIPRKGYQFAAEVAIESPAGQMISNHGGMMVLGGVESTTRIVVEEEIDDLVRERPEPDARRMLPPPPEPRGRWRKIASWISIGALAGALAVWVLYRPTPFPKVVRSVQLTRSGRVEPFSRVLSDGSRVFFSERMGGIWNLAQIPESGGQSAQVATSIDNIVLYGIDRRRGRLLVASRRSNESSDPLWVVSTAGGAARRIGDVLVSDAIWSPDAQQIVYAVGAGLYVVGDDGLQPQKLFVAPGLIDYLHWSPDGQHVSFTVMDPSGVTSLWEVGPDGRNPHSVSFGWKPPVARWGEGECCGQWSPNGEYFIFRSQRDFVYSFWMVRSDKGLLGAKGYAPVQLCTSPDRLSQPEFSADGRKIVFVNFQERRELVRYDSEKKIFVPHLGGIPARHLSFSHDGQWVAYKNEPDGTLWRSRADGSEALQLTFSPLDTYHPTWSPDGKKIAFEGSGKLYVVPFDGGKAEPLISGDGKDRQPSWSPDGKSILFVRALPSERGPQRVVYQYAFETGQVQRMPGTEGFEDPQWSPDGKYAVAGDRNGHRLVLYDFSRQHWSELAKGEAFGWGIRWSSDSKYVYYQFAFVNQEQPIFRVRISDRKVEQITSSRQIFRADVLSYTMTGLTPDNSPLASLVRRNSDIYALELDLP